jgi:hypothetical protein
VSAEIARFPAHRCRPSIAEQREERLHWLAAEFAKAFPQMSDPMEAAKRIADGIERGITG